MEDVLESSTKKFKCNICNVKTYSKSSNLSRHKVNCRNPTKFECESCKNTFSRPDSLKVHKKTCKGRIKVVICSVCGKDCVTRWRLKRHVEQTHAKNTQTFPCPKCSKVYVRECHQLAHVQVCTVESIDESNNEYDDISVFPSFIDDIDLTLNVQYNSTVDFQAELNTVAYDEISLMLESSGVHCFTSVNDGITSSIANTQLNSVVCSEAKLQQEPTLDENDSNFTSLNDNTTISASSTQLSTPVKRFCKTASTPLSILQSVDIPLTPNTRQRKAYRVNQLQKHLEELELSKDDLIDVLKQTLQNMNLLDCLTSQPITLAGRKTLSFDKRKDVWDYWHAKSTASTLTSRPAKLKVSDRNKVQSGLEFVSTVTIITQRNRQFYQSCWMTVHVPYKQLHREYLHTTSDHVSYGTFIALKPFYVRGITTADMEMCCCKKHLHARWVIQALINLAKKNNMSLPFTDYSSFFNHIHCNCDNSQSSTYLSWSCTPDKNTLCNDISSNWLITKDRLLENCDEKVTEKFKFFEKVVVESKKTGKERKVLKEKCIDANMDYLTSFLSNILTDIIHHRNHLKHYRTCIHELEVALNATIIDIDFSENLSVPVKYEPQSKHWSHEQVSVHSGILKKDGLKYYHPYFSNDKNHDQIFVKCVVEDMIKEVVRPGETLIVESDNCCSQYKSAEHFYNIQELANKYDINVIYLYGIAGHGKGEVDHVGGIAKVSIRREIAAGGFMADAGEMVEFIKQKFDFKTNPTYVVKEVLEKDLEVARAENKLKHFKTIDGSSKFQVLSFSPKCSSFRAAPYICICESCLTKYGSCSLFHSYDLNVQMLNEIYLRTNQLQNLVSSPDDKVDDDINDFFCVNSFVAVATGEDSMSGDTVWFIKVIREVEEANESVKDSWGNTALVGQKYLIGHFLHRAYSTSKGQFFKLDIKNETILHKESIVYPFVNIEERKKGFFLADTDYADVLRYIESRGIQDVTDGMQRGPDNS